MNIASLKTMRGANYWSAINHKLIVMKLELNEEFNLSKQSLNSLSKKLEDIYEQSVHYLKTEEWLVTGKENTLPDIVLDTVVKIYSLTGWTPDFKNMIKSNDPNIYHIIFSYNYEEVGREVAITAIEMIKNISSGKNFNLAENLEKLEGIFNSRKLGPSTYSIVKEAVKRDIPYTRLNDNSLIMFGHGANQRIIKATMTGLTSSIGVDLAGDKEATKRLLSKEYIPVPEGGLIENEEDIQSVIEQIGFPVAIKPLDANHGRGITTNINTLEHAIEAFRHAKTLSENVIVEKFISGNDYRFLVINYKLVAVAKRTPPRILGDGKSTIAQLIDNINKDPERGEGHEKNLTKVKIDEVTESILTGKNYTINSILPKGEVLVLKPTANISTGGTARDVTDMVHPLNVFLAERVARLMKLDICGLDVISENISVPITQNNGAILEVNACPGFRMHLNPTKGLPRNVAEAVIDSLYPNNEPSRIPLVAITGTNGKTTTTRLIAHLASTAGKCVGYTTTEGIYINGQQIYSGDCSGPSSASVILRDPIVNFGVLECARGGILRAGLGYDKCNISVITNVTEDHLGLNDIHTIEELAKVKSVVAKSTTKDGYAILNADDELVYNMQNELACNIALFSMHVDNPRIKQHCQKGGLAASIENGFFIICKGEWKIRILKVIDAPLSFMGTSNSMMQNILGAILAAYTSNIKIKQIAEGLKAFEPTPQNTPGRMNIFDFNDLKIMVDYAHNEGGYKELKSYLDQLNVSQKVGIVAATGDRRPEDIRKIGYYAAQMFDKTIIRHDKDGRGRTNDELSKLIIEGINSVNPDHDVKVISNEFEAINYAKEHALKDTFIVACADKVEATLNFVAALQKKEKELQYDTASV